MSMGHAIVRQRIRWFVLLADMVVASAIPAQTFAQTPARPALVRRLSVDDAVKLALEQNLGIQVERFNPQIQDLAVAHARRRWVPEISTTLEGDHTNVPINNAFAGGIPGQTNIVSNTVSSQVGVAQTLPTGGNYSAAWNGARLSSTNFFNSFNPQLTSYVTLNFSQPLLRNFKIDEIRHDVETSRNDRDESEVHLREAIIQTTRNVKDAYWDLTYQIDNLRAQQDSLNLSKQALSDNEKRVQAGTMASLDIVQAQAEVARNEEAVIVADAAIKEAEDRLRVMIFNPSTPDFWTVGLEPTEMAAFQPREVDVDAAMRRALETRSDVQTERNAVARHELDQKYYQNQTLPDVSAHVSYVSNGIGGDKLAGLTTFPPVGPVERSVLFDRGFTAVLGDVFSSTFPTWTVGVTITRPLGTSASEASLARARLEASQAQTRLKNVELHVASEVRDAGRQVQTNQKRVESARAARELAERRLDAEQRKFAAGIQTNFFVFQAQRDLAQARTDEARAMADYNKSLVDFDAVQEAPLK
jgi:outer membrane protein TolC